MSIFQTIILGIVQGATEFIPISSSGHLVLVPYLFGWDLPEKDAFIFNVLVQVATLIAVFAYYWKDLVKIFQEMIRSLIQRNLFISEESRLGWYLIISTIPAGIAGILLKDPVERAFNNITATAVALIFTAIILLTAEYISRQKSHSNQINWFDALWIGVFQILAIFPGISRSGSTITGGMTRNFDRPTAARYSFLMSVPIMLAAGALEVSELFSLPDISSILPPFLIGFIVAGIVGYFSIKWLIGYLTKKPLFIFSIYCGIVGILLLVLPLIRG